MKKNLAKKIVLGLLTGAVLMSSSVAWADSSDQSLGVIVGLNSSGNVVMTSFYVGPNNMGSDSGSVRGDYSIAIGASATVGGASVAQSYPANNAVAVGHNAHVGGAPHIQNDGLNGVAIGASAYVHGSNNVALGYGSYAGTESNVVSVGSGGNLTGDFPETRRIINVTAGVDGNDAVNKAQLDAAIASVQGGNVNLSNYYTKAETDGTFATKDYVDNNFVKIETQKDANNNDVSVLNVIDSSIVVKKDTTTVGVNIDYGGITVGEHSTHMNESGFYACDGGSHDYDGANAAMMKDGRIKGAGGAFTVDASGNVTATNLYNITQVDGALAQKANVADVYKKTETYNQTEVDTKLDSKADKATTLEGYGIKDAYTKTEVDNMLGGSSDAISGINQRLDKTNAKINKVGAGAAALAALHPLEYDPDDKLTFSAGMGNYAGENAAALGAFYRPNEKFMVSLGGTMGNGENMVNLGLSIGLDKPNGYAKLSKRELIQKVNAMEAKYEAVEAEKEAMKADNEAMKAEMAEMKAMLQAILAKK